MRMLFSEKFACPVSGFTISEIEPRLFSFNNPFGACPACDGLGTSSAIDPDAVVPDEKPVAARGRHPALGQDIHLALLRPDARRAGRSTTASSFDDGAWSSCRTRRQQRRAARHRRGDLDHLQYDDGLRSYKTTKTFEGVIRNLERRWKETESTWAREEIERYMSTPLPSPAAASG
jgi:excinuclease ABC subunit A